MQTHSQTMKFGADAWSILSDIELSIKNKIEAVGTPLKDWNVDIFRGVLTGYNDAFIISSEKREEILANCIDESERQRTAAIIRPILRGRDIKRYGYSWSGLWLINTHNGTREGLERIHIEDYPSVKEHLDNYWLSIEKRADKGETPYNLRNCAYLDDFDKPKLMYPNMTKYLPFYYDRAGFFSNDKSFLVVGKHIAFLTAFLNSSVFKFCFAENFPELQGGTKELRKIFFDKVRVVEINDEKNAEFERAVADIQQKYTHEKAQAIDCMVFDLYGLSEAERELISFV